MEILVQVPSKIQLHIEWILLKAQVQQKMQFFIVLFSKHC